MLILEPMGLKEDQQHQFEKPQHLKMKMKSFHRLNRISHKNKLEKLDPTDLERSLIHALSVEMVSLSKKN